MTKISTTHPRYIPDYSRAHPLTWGRAAGCDFATKSCMELSQQAALLNLPSPFCNSLMADSERTFCTADKSSVGSCNLVMYNEPLPSIYQNFQSIEGVSSQDISKVGQWKREPRSQVLPPQVGSSVTLADFCPYVQEFTWQGGGVLHSCIIN